MSSSYKLVIVIPALNEEVCLPKLLASIKKQRKQQNLSEVIIVDNGSVDRTTNIAREFGATLLFCKKKGIGTARQTGVNYILKKYQGKLNKTILFQLDADEELLNSWCFDVLLKKFSRFPSLMVSVGPTQYEVRRLNYKKKIIKTGRGFRNLFNTETLDELFTRCGRSANDYLIPAKFHKLFIGGNTAYRASVFTLPKVSFPLDDSWETIVLSVRIQQYVKPTQIKFIKEQTVKTSSRSYTNKSGFLTKKNLAKIQKKGYIPPFKSLSVMSPYLTLMYLIKQLDTEKQAKRLNIA